MLIGKTVGLAVKLVGRRKAGRQQPPSHLEANGSLLLICISFKFASPTPPLCLPYDEPGKHLLQD